MSRLARSLWLQVLAAALLGAAVGALRPSLGVALQPLGDGFIRLVRMIIAPIIFTTVVAAIAKVGGQRKTGRVAWRAIVTFEVLTTIALGLGVLAGWVFGPGAGMNVDPKRIDVRAIAGYTTAGRALTASEFILGIIPKDVVDAFAKDDVLQVIFLEVLFGIAVAGVREAGTEVLAFVEDLSALLFRISPLGVLVLVGASVPAFVASTPTITWLAVSVANWRL